MPVIGYMCSYVPFERIKAMGLQVVSLGNLTVEPGDRSRELPVNMCGFVRYCQSVVDDLELDGLVLTNCCNGMQRLYDYIKVKRPELFCWMLELPRGIEWEENNYFKQNADRMLREICEHFSIDESVEQLKYLQNEKVKSIEIEADTIYILGSAVSPKMREFLEEQLRPHKVRMNLCHTRSTGDDILANLATSSTNVLKEAYTAPCARKQYFIEWYEKFALENKPQLAGLIYISSQNCDSFLFRYTSIQKICREYGIPVINLEEDYGSKSFGQISTRIEAFKESINFDKEAKAAEAYLDAGGDTRTFRQRMNLIRAIVPKLPLKAIQRVVENQVEIFTQTMWEEPDKIIWTNMVMPMEIFYAAGLVPVNMELVAGWLASIGLSRELISKCEGMGFSSSLCSYHKAALGLLANGGLPAPKAAVVSSHICDGSLGVAYHFVERYGSSIKILEVPFVYTEENIAYLTGQYKELIKWIEGYTGKAFDMEALRHAMELSNKAREYWLQVLELRKGEPLFPGFLSLRNLYGATFLFGSRLGYDVARTYYEQLHEIRNCTERTDAPSKKRLLWIHFAPLYNNRIMEYLEKELNCWIVMDITGHIYWKEYDLDKPLESLASRMLSHFYLDSAEKRKELFIRLVQEYNIDGIVHFMHNGCRAIPGAAWLVREVANELRLPFLDLSGDCIDPRGFSEEQMRLRMEAFSEALGRDRFVSGN